MAVTSSCQDSVCEVSVTKVDKEKKSRSKCPGVRIIGGRIYDSDNGKTCHQCRQKTRDFAAECKNLIGGSKQCTIKYCHKCLLNRYGERAEEVALLDDWTCPKCKGICNCSFCMKKKGHKPTGILVHTAKKKGLSSVSELLQMKGPESFGYDRIAKDPGACLNKSAFGKESAVASSRKLGKENSYDGNSDSHSQELSQISSKKNRKKIKREELEDANSGDASLRDHGRKKPRLVEGISTNKSKINGNDEGHVLNTCMSKAQSEDIPKEEIEKTDKVDSVNTADKKPKEESQDVSKKEARTSFKAQMSKDIVVGLTAYEKRVAIRSRCEKPVKQPPDVSKKEVKNNMNIRNHKNLCVLSGINCGIKDDTIELPSEQIVDDIPLPSGNELNIVAGIELPHEDAGHALQFFEFCAAFGEILDIKKGQAESLIRAIIYGREGRRSRGSLLVQFHIKLLSLMLQDLGEESPVLSTANGQTSWLKALGKCVSDKKFMSNEFSSDIFDRGNEKYDVLNSSQKFKLLNFLCDEALNTKDLRSWIDDKNSEFVEKEKEAKEKVFAAKDKEKNLKQKVQDEVAKVIIAKSGAPFSVSEHEAVLSQIKKEAAQAHAELLAAMGMVPKKRQRSDAVRTDPIIPDVNGHVFWKLKGHDNQSAILLQDIGNRDSVACEDKWFVYDAEQRRGIEKYISSLR